MKNIFPSILDAMLSYFQMPDAKRWSSISPPIIAIEFGALETLLALVTVPFRYNGLADSSNVFKMQRRLTVLCRCPTQPYTAQMEPFSSTVFTVASDHFAIADLVAVAITILFRAIFVIFFTLHGRVFTILRCSCGCDLSCQARPFLVRSFER